MGERRWPAARRSLVLLWCAAIGIAARSQAMTRLALRGGGNAGNEVGAGLSPDRAGGTVHAPDQAQSGPGRVSLRVVEVRPTHEELRVPDHVESIKEAVGLALDGQTIYVRAGEHRWRGEMIFARNTTFFVRGELGSRLWGQWQRRLVQPRAGTDNYCVCLPFGSQGSLGSLVLAHDTLGSFDACLHVSGGPWLLGQCKVLSNHATALLANGAADLLVRRCSLGGLEPAECVDEQVFGENLARYGLYAVGNASISLQACVIENTGRTGGIGARFSSSAAGVLLGCMLRCNDIALSLDDRARVAVRGTTVQVALALPCVVQPCVTLLPACPNLTRGQQRNAWSAWHVGYRCFTCQLDLSDNTVIGREWFNIRRPGQRIPRYHSCCNGRGYRAPSPLGCAGLPSAANQQAQTDSPAAARTGAPTVCFQWIPWSPRRR